MSIVRNAGIVLLCLLPLLAQGNAEPQPAQDPAGPRYIEMLPPFVVNIGSSGRIGYLKTAISLRVDAAAVATVEQHMPALRHEIIMVLSDQSTETLAAPEQREALRLAALAAVRNVIAETTAVAPVTAAKPATAQPQARKMAAPKPVAAIQDLLFTSFITQR